MNSKCFLFSISILLTFEIVAFPITSIGASAQGGDCKGAVRLDAIGQARELQTSLIVIDLIKRDKAADALVFLERQIKSHLVMLKALKSEFDLSDDDLLTINDAIEESEKYLAKQGRPDEARRNPGK